MDIEKVDLKGVDRFKLCCKAEVGTSAHRESVVVGPKSVDSTEEASLPRLTFCFQNTDQTASLFFTFLDLNGTPDQTELGSCFAPLVLPCSPSLLPEASTQVLVQAWVPLTKQLHVALIKSRIAGTELFKYIGKLRFTAHVILRTSGSTPQPSDSNSQATLQSRPTQDQVTSPAPTPTPTNSGLPRDSDSLKNTQESARSTQEQMATLESTLTPSNARSPPRVSIDAEQTLEEAAGSETSLPPQDSVTVPQANTLSSILTEHDPAIGANNGSTTFPTLAEYEETIPRMGLDIMKLREENQSLRKKAEQLQTQIHEMESRAITSTSKQFLESLPKADLIQRIGKLEERLLIELQSKKSCQGRVQHLNNELIKKNELVAQYIQLQEVHTALQKLVQQLQSKIQKYKKCSQICQQQEATITQLESLLAQQAQGRGYAESDSISLVTRENAQLRRELQQYRDSDSEPISAALRDRDDTIQSLKAELSITARKCQELEFQIAEGSSSQICELEQQLIAAETQVGTLMAEIQDYELQLAEHRRSEPIARGRQTQSTAHGLHGWHNVVPGGSEDTHSTAAILNGPSLASHKTTF